MIAACDARFGRLDGLVNAAGLSMRGTLDDTSVELWDRLFAVNVRAPFLLTQEAARADAPRAARRQRRQHHHDGQPRRRARADGLLGLEGRAGDAHAQRRLRAAARPHPRQRPEHRLDGDRGRARRADRRPGQPADWLAEADASRPFGRLLRPDDIAPMVTYLLSDAAQMVTGSVIDFDQTVHGPYGEHVPAAAEVAA